ncbi:MAG: hypothetical protein NTX16_11865 [Actinobacteria bacterium]|nr:hypothetical protein [Actinomycetota bacterium]
MNRMPLRKATPLGRMHSHFAIVVMLVFTVGLLLAVPATADAHVVKAHRAQYAKMLKTWDFTHTGLEQYFDAESGSLSILSNEMSQLIGSPEPGAQARIQVDEMAAKALAGVLTKAAANGRDRVDKKIESTRKKVRRSWFKPPKDYGKFVVNMLPVMIYFTDYWNALDKLAAAAQALSSGDIATYAQRALDALNLENEGNVFFESGMTSLGALL